MNAHAARSIAWPAVRPVWLIGIVLIWLCYVLLFLAANPRDFSSALLSSAANAMPLILLAPGIDLILRNRVIARPRMTQTLAHAALGPTFALLWYGGILVLQALVRGAEGQDWEIRGFSGLALGWQMFQGLILYAAIAAIVYARAFAAMRPNADRVDVPPAFERYLTRIGDAIAPVDVDDIVSIEGAQDYSEVTTRRGRHLARLSLGEFERRLDPGRFIRIHRSAIINLARLERAEPAGDGRLLVLLESGRVIQTSRAGARRLRAILY